MHSNPSIQFFIYARGLLLIDRAEKYALRWSLNVLNSTLFAYVSYSQNMQTMYSKPSFIKKLFTSLHLYIGG